MFIIVIFVVIIIIFVIIVISLLFVFIYSSIIYSFYFCIEKKPRIFRGLFFLSVFYFLFVIYYSQFSILIKLNKNYYFNLFSYHYHYSFG